MSSSTYIELQENNDVEAPPNVEAPPPDDGRTSRDKVCCVFSFIMLIICIILYSILAPYSDSVACPDCNTFCDKCDCVILNGTQSQIDICEKCVTCVAGECNNFSHNVSGRFADIFWWAAWASLFMSVLTCGSDQRHTPRRNPEPRVEPPREPREPRGLR